MIIQITNFLSCVRSDHSKDELQSSYEFSLVCNRRDLCIGLHLQKKSGMLHVPLSLHTVTGEPIGWNPEEHAYIPTPRYVKDVVRLIEALWMPGKSPLQFTAEQKTYCLPFIMYAKVDFETRFVNYLIIIILESHTCFDLEVKLWIAFIDEMFIHWASKGTYHFFRAKLTKIHAIKNNHIWAQISFNTPL